MSTELRTGYKLTEVGVIPKDWNVIPLDAVGQFKNGINKSAEAFGHGSPFVNLLDVFGVCSINSGDAFGLVKTSHAEQKTYDLKRGDVIFIRSSVKPSGVGLTAVVETDLPKTVYSGFLIRFRDDDTVDIGFKRHCFYAEYFRRKLTGASSVSANTNINQDNLKKLLIALPPNKTEQRAIAAALSDVDALLGGLDRLIAKKRHLKQAAMQQLLTGQTRLPGFSGEWEVKRLDEVAEIVSGGTPRTNEPSYWNGEIKWCTPTDITRFSGKYLADTERTISSDGLRNSGASILPIGALLLCSRATIGELKVAGVPICTNQGFKSIVCRAEFSSEFFYYKLQTMKQQMIERAFGSTFLEISTKNVAALEVEIPLLAEQTAIATVLSDSDTELDALQARRSKTQALKQAMMQELLTGRIRLV